MKIKRAKLFKHDAGVEKINEFIKDKNDVTIEDIPSVHAIVVIWIEEN